MKLGLSFGPAREIAGDAFAFPGLWGSLAASGAPACSGMPWGLRLLLAGSWTFSGAFAAFGPLPASLAPWLAWLTLPIWRESSGPGQHQIG